MGPRLMSRGGGIPGDGEGGEGTASMGPRLMSRGGARAVLGRGRLGGASMGPRLMSRGGASDVNQTFGTDKLQWGRDS